MIERPTPKDSTPASLTEQHPQPLALSGEDAAGMLGISRGHFLKLHASDHLGPKPIRLGRCVRWLRDDLIAWLKADCPPRERWDQIKEARHGR